MPDSETSKRMVFVNAKHLRFHSQARLASVVVHTRLSYVTTFICHIKANTPAFQQIYLLHNNFAQFSSSIRSNKNYRRKIDTKIVRVHEASLYCKFWLIMKIKSSLPFSRTFRRNCSQINFKRHISVEKWSLETCLAICVISCCY